MCEPITAIAGLVLGAVGTTVNVVGQQNAAAKNDEIAKANIGIADAAAADALRRGGSEAGAHRVRAGQMVGAQRVAAGASGTAVDVGTSANLQDSTRAIGELDAQTARNNAWREAWGYKTQKSEIAMGAQLARQSADLGTFSSLLQGASGLAYGLKNLKGGK